MKRLECEQCGKLYPMNDMVKSEESGKKFCKPCADKALQNTENPLEGEIKKLIDPTVCAYCNADPGSSQLPTIAGLPVCSQCDVFLRNRPFPLWIKLSFVAVVVLVIFSIGWNLRFIRAYIEMNDSFKLMAQGNLAQASASMSSSAMRVPESADVQILANYMQGLFLLYQDKSAEALEKFNQCEDKLPVEFGVEERILEAKIGVAFKSQNYDEFLDYAKVLEHKYPDFFQYKAQLASAYACKFAQTGNEKFREQAMTYLSKSREMAQDNPYFKEYEERILHRLHSKKIISAEEFKRRFPGGWNPDFIE